MTSIWLPFESEFFVNLAIVVFGLIVGSFLNVLVVRIPREEEFVKTRSHCPKCKAVIRWFDNIPVFSYLFLHGKCRNCRAGISIRYPIIECLTALLFLAAKIRFGMSPLLVIRDWPILASFIVITFIDLEHRIIPNVLSIGGTVFAIGCAAFFPELSLERALIGALGGFGIFYGIDWIYEKMTKRYGLGGGDIKFLAFIGAFLGLTGVLHTILVSSITGSVIGIAWALMTRKKRLMRVAIPYGPFLVLGALLDYFMGEWLWNHLNLPI